MPSLLPRPGWRGPLRLVRVEGTQVSAMVGAGALDAAGLAEHPVLALLDVAATVPEVSNAGKISAEIAWWCRD